MGKGSCPTVESSGKFAYNAESQKATYCERYQSNTRALRDVKNDDEEGGIDEIIIQDDGHREPRIMIILTDVIRPRQPTCSSRKEPRVVVGRSISILIEISQKSILF